MCIFAVFGCVVGCFIVCFLCLRVSGGLGVCLIGCLSLVMCLLVIVFVFLLFDGSFKCLSGC